MSELNSVLMILIPIGVGIAIGQLLFHKKGGAAVGVYSLIGAVSTSLWVAVGVFMIIGGLEIFGMIVIIVGFYLARGNWQRYKKERNARTTIAGGGS